MPIHAALTSGQIAVARSGLVDYESALKIQRNFHAEIVADERPSTLILLEHPSVYTAGKRTQSFEMPSDGTPLLTLTEVGELLGTGQVNWSDIQLLNY